MTNLLDESERVMVAVHRKQASIDRAADRLNRVDAADRIWQPSAKAGSQADPAANAQASYSPSKPARRSASASRPKPTFTFGGKKAAM
ncbi:hypothetical protein [Paraburkholderia kururiensis]|uniref:Uncharacterized protein n=1 Tax=Paraburkholderia kururiensis TaxID=984307 RepID=A0ABZ0WK48_9BURK|nr:hypothetical protein [Paraburkholderia kururiensis]WQD77680.1 hypothetical protein U0042_27160 [Paraburkholderia kururiensis]